MTSSLKLSFEGRDTALAGMCAQEVRKQILENVPPDTKISLERQNPAAMQFFDSIVIEAAGSFLVTAIFKVLEHYQRPRGVTLRVELGGRVAILDDVNPKAIEELYNLKTDSPEKK